MGCKHGHAIADCPDATCRGEQNTLDSIADMVAKIKPIKPPECPNCQGPMVPTLLSTENIWRCTECDPIMILNQ